MKYQLTLIFLSFCLILCSRSFGQDKFLLIDTVLIKYEPNSYYVLEIDSIWISNKNLEDLRGSRGRKNVCIFEGERKGNLPWNGWAICYGPDGIGKKDSQFFKDGRPSTPISH